MEKQYEKTADAPTSIEVRGARVHNLKNIDVDIPLGTITGIAGVSGSGKSSLALGVLYAEGSGRYLEALSTYTRRRMTQTARADVDEVLYIPAALALHQRPAVPGIRSTFGTGTELLNGLRLMYSRLASHECPNGHYVPPSLNVAAGKELTCPVCGVHFHAPSAEELSFNSQGACRTCGGTGMVHMVDRASLIPDENLSIDDGAVAPWKTLMWSLMTDVCRAMGVRTDIPFKDDKGMKRVSRFLKEETCPDCQGSRFSETARKPHLRGIPIDEACRMTLGEITEWVKGVPETLPDEMCPMAESICGSFMRTAARLMDLGLSYLSLDRAGSTLSTGERQRMQLARAVRNRTTGVLYVLDEPSIGLHPSNIEGLCGVMKDLVSDGNSVVLVDHDTQILKEASWIVEMGPDAGSDGGNVIAEGTVEDIGKNPKSKIGRFLSGNYPRRVFPVIPKEKIFSEGCIRMKTGPIHTVKPLDAEIPKGRLTVVTGVSGSGKTTMVLESLIPGLSSSLAGEKLPGHVLSIDPSGIKNVKLIDSTPIGINVRSTVATYANVHDELRKIYARSEGAKEKGFKAGDFSYNTGKLRCSVCDGTGVISLDVQSLPDVEIPCPSCHGSRYGKEAEGIRLVNKKGEARSLPELMDMDVNHALEFCQDMKLVKRRLEVLKELGLGYLTLGEETPGLSRGEAQRLKLASEMGRAQEDTIFIFDEPTIGLHPLDVRTLLSVFRALVDHGATLIVIEHDLDVIRNADYIIDMGPGGGEEGGRIIACGSPEEIADSPKSITGKYLRPLK